MASIKVFPSILGLWIDYQAGYLQWLAGAMKRHHLVGG
jgi:hypothetical protein